ncbi:unnamed protein product [Ambrosiozyma monospora]|uniref:Unnamed protein product n=1 Tax=Ambrosiozyma monospora TaxID=43982 RepID=A0A9W7DJF3_AMBMO|nr:unnamed protein product [Ambrosiozyma monospora]
MVPDSQSTTLSSMLYDEEWDRNRRSVPITRPLTVVASQPTAFQTSLSGNQLSRPLPPHNGTNFNSTNQHLNSTNTSNTSNYPVVNQTTQTALSVLGPASSGTSKETNAKYGMNNNVVSQSSSQVGNQLNSSIEMAGVQLATWDAAPVEKAEEEAAAKKKAGEEAAKKKEEDEAAAKKKVEEEAAQERARNEAISKKKTEDAIAAAKKKAEEDIVAKKAEEESRARKEETKRRAEEAKLKSDATAASASVKQKSDEDLVAQKKVNDANAAASELAKIKAAEVVREEAAKQKALEKERLRRVEETLRKQEQEKLKAQTERLRAREQERIRSEREKNLKANQERVRLEQLNREQEHLRRNSELDHLRKERDNQRPKIPTGPKNDVSKISGGSFTFGDALKRSALSNSSSSSASFMNSSKKATTTIIPPAVKHSPRSDGLPFSVNRAFSSSPLFNNNNIGSTNHSATNVNTSQRKPLVPQASQSFKSSSPASTTSRVVRRNPSPVASRKRSITPPPDVEVIDLTSDGEL